MRERERASSVVKTQLAFKQQLAEGRRQEAYHKVARNGTEGGALSKYAQGIA
jgi:hypothetical protein